MLLERRTVSRKTPLDGKLEISASTSARLAGLSGLIVETDTESGGARLESMACTCSRGVTEGRVHQHVHHFVQSPVLKRLTPGAGVALELEEASATLRVLPTTA